MLYNWECCSFYPNNFGASALRQVMTYRPLGSIRVSTGLCTCFHRPVDDNRVGKID